MEPVTESSNPITADIDLASPAGIVKLLSQCDGEIFSGWRLYKSLYDDEVRSSVNEVATIASTVINNDKGMVVLSGCGTSGRLAFVVARTFNKILSGLGRKVPKFRYTIAGGDRALLLSTEAGEDSWKMGVEDLERIAGNADSVLFIGITCGLSAPYVAGQLDHCLARPDKYTAVLLGFNPVEMARKTPISDSDKTFYDVASKMADAVSDKGKTSFIINPVVGPEQITGSSRMKSGSATKILLETTFYIALNRMLNSKVQQKFPVEKLFQLYEHMHRETYLLSNDIAKLLQQAGNSLCNKGRVCYLGNDSPGIMSVIDASECPPTYGASYDDIRGFLNGGWSTMQNYEGDLSPRGEEYQLDMEYYRKNVLSTLTHKDTVIFVCTDSTGMKDFDQLVMATRKQQCHIGLVTTTSEKNMTALIDSSVCLTMPETVISAIIAPWIHPDLLSSVITSLSELSVKWILNAISTGAHMLKGKVLGNRMIDMQASNSKLYNRAIGIIQTFSDVDRSVAEGKLLVAIYGNEVIDPAHGISQHILKATGKEMVVPKAILMARSGCTLEEAERKFAANPIVRKALA